MSDNQDGPPPNPIVALGPPDEGAHESITRICKMEGAEWYQPLLPNPEPDHYLDLFEVLMRGCEKTLICYAEENAWESSGEPWITADDEFTGTPFGMLVFEGFFKFCDVEFRRIAVGFQLKGISEFIVSRRMHTIPSLMFHNFPVEVEAMRGLVMSAPAAAEHSMIIRAVLCNQQEYVTLMLCPEVPLTTKVLTTYLHLYPKLCDLAPYALGQYTYETYCARFELDLAGIGDLTKHEKTVHFHALTLIFALCAAYSRNDRLGAQLLARYKSGKQSVSMQVMSDSDFLTVFNKCGNIIEDLPGEVLTVIGKAVAITSDKSVDIMVRTRHLLPASEAVELMGGNRWAQGVYTQIRLVYQRHHMTTVDFAERALNLILAHGLLYDPAFNKERDALLNAVKISADRPYIGLQGTQMEALQIAKFPFWAVVGADYHAATLTGKDLEEWKKFNTDGLVKHLAYPYQRDMALKMSQSIPSPFMANALRAAKADDTMELNRALALLPPNSEEVVYSSLAKDPDPGPWYHRKLSVRYNKTATEIRELALEHVKPDVDAFVATIDMHIENASTAKGRKILRAFKNKKNKERAAAISKYGSKTFQIPMPSEAVMRELVDFGKSLITDMKSSSNEAEIPLNYDDGDEE